eukprot:3638516-Amphidinium_carterae.1
MHMVGLFCRWSLFPLGFGAEMLCDLVASTRVWSSNNAKCANWWGMEWFCSSKLELLQKWARQWEKLLKYIGTFY